MDRTEIFLWIFVALAIAAIIVIAILSTRSPTTATTDDTKNNSIPEAYTVDNIGYEKSDPSEYKIYLLTKTILEDYQFKLMLRKPLKDAIKSLTDLPFTPAKVLDSDSNPENTDTVKAIFVHAFSEDAIFINYLITFITDLSKIKNCNVTFITNRNDMLPDDSCKFLPGFKFSPFPPTRYTAENVSKDRCLNQLKRKFGDIRKEPEWQQNQDIDADTVSNYIIHHNKGYGDENGTCVIGNSSGCGQVIDRLYVSSVIDETKFVC